MDELSIAETSESSSSGNAFLLQQVPVEMEKLLKGKDWPAIADTQMKEVFTMTDRDDADLRRMISLYTDDYEDYSFSDAKVSS